jgi:hypothetical protein
MEFRYLGFEQSQNARSYRFDVTETGGTIRHFVVTVDLALFHTHHVGIQEGPSLCAQKLAADLEACINGVHELTTEDLQAYVGKRAAAEAQRLEMRKGGFRRTKNPPIPSQSPWRPK